MKEQFVILLQFLHIIYKLGIWKIGNDKIIGKLLRCIIFPKYFRIKTVSTTCSSLLAIIAVHVINISVHAPSYA